MSIITNKTTIALATSAVLTAGLALSPTLASADTNPFASAELSSGYMQLAEGKCGENMKKEHEAKCGENMKKEAEGKCGDKMKKDAKKMKDGKCGENMKKEHEAKCGANKK